MTLCNISVILLVPIFNNTIINNYFKIIYIYNNSIICFDHRRTQPYLKYGLPFILTW